MALGLSLKSGKLTNPIKVSEAHARNFKGQWIAIIDEKIVAHNRDVGKVIDATREHYKGKKPEFLRISGGEIAMY
ncbi:hypothetical protein HYX10_03045 [Candidatus Woesearchaeota archaeon]|nr:hypothetical protein [Candidatus Woesearchaeota archaeon]